MNKYDYIVIPGKLYQHGLDLEHLVAFSVILGASQNKMGIYLAGPAYIAECALVSEKKAEQIIKDLWEKGLIERVRDYDGRVGWQAV